MHKFGYQIVGENLPESVETPKGKYSVVTPWDYLCHAKYACSALPMPAAIIDITGRVVYRNFTAKLSRYPKISESKV